MKTPLSARRAAGLVALLAASAALAQAEEAAIEWRHRASQAGVALTANPLGSVSRASFYEGRGFTNAAIQPYAQSCGFSFGMQNASPRPIDVRLADWQAIDAGGQRIPLRLPAEWDAEWERAGVPQPARIAFRWAQFQAENHFEPGDWIMGMATLAKRPAAPFRLVARYQDDQGSHEIQIDHIACAAN